MNNQYKAAMILASGHFLSDYFPENWEDMSEEKLNQFVVDNAWERLEGCPAEEILDNIEVLAGDFIRVANGEIEGLKKS
jgi:hypothetical protein